MQLKNFLSLVLIVLSPLSVFFPRFVFGYHFTHPDAEALSKAIALPLDSELLRNIPVRYFSLPRNEVSIQDLLELRYQMQHWRTRVVRRYLLDSSTYEKALVGFQADPNYEFGTIHGARLSSAGPKILLDIPPVHGSKWTYRKWSNLKGQERYKILNRNVWFRGQELRSGDLLLGDLAIDNAAFFSMIGEAETYLPHFAIYVLMEKNGSPLPAVLEMHKLGLQAVPLNVYFSDHFSSYTEVYRLKEPPTRWGQILSETADILLTRQFAYDLTASSPDETYLTCAEFGKLILKSTGVSPVTLHTPVRPGAEATLEALKLHFKKFLAPSNFVQDSRFIYVGAVDNRHISHTVARQLVVHHLGTLMKTHVLDLEALPKSFAKDKSWVEKIQEGGHLTAVLKYMAGYGGQRFPLGSAEAISIMPLFRKAFSEAVTVVEDTLRIPLFEMNALSIHDLQEDQNMIGLLDRATPGLRKWFALVKEYKESESGASSV